MEEFYSECYHQQLSQGVVRSDFSEKLSERLHNLLDTALRVAEEFFDLKPKGTLIDRCRRLEQAGWDHIYRLKPQSSTVQRGLADLVAEEASLRIWHMRIVESFVAVTGHYVREKATVERFAETSLLLWDLVARIKGENPFHRPQLGEQCVQMTIGEPISVSERWHDYQANRRRAVANLTKELQTALERAIAIE